MTAQRQALAAVILRHLLAKGGFGQGDRWLVLALARCGELQAASRRDASAVRQAQALFAIPDAFGVVMSYSLGALYQ